MVSKHAQAAQQNPDAAVVREGYHLEGLLEEYKGNSTAAAKKYKEGIDRYKKAIEVHRGPRTTRSVGRRVESLDRGLGQGDAPAQFARRGRGRQAADAPAASNHPSGRTTRRQRAAQSAGASGDLGVRAQLVALLITGVMVEVDDVDETPQEKAEVYARATAEQKVRLDEAEALLELAKKLPPASRGSCWGEAHMMKGRVYIEQAKNGEDTGTRGLKYYVQGRNEYYPGDETERPAQSAGGHPRTQGGTASTQNPRLADEYFGKGLAFFGGAPSRRRRSNSCWRRRPTKRTPAITISSVWRVTGRKPRRSGRRPFGRGDRARMRKRPTARTASTSTRASSACRASCDSC